MNHPILARPGRLAIYSLSWLAFGALFAGAFVFAGGAPVAWALRFALPLAVVLGFQLLASWYLVRVLPPESTTLPRLLAAWTGAGVVSVGIWAFVGRFWTVYMFSVTSLPAARQAELVGQTMPLVVLVGAFGFVIAVLAHYLLAALEQARAAERRVLEASLHAREAELAALKAQLDPHFLFNSLNSVAALIGTDARAARRMCFLMAGFFRKSLGLARRESIALEEEVYLAETFLAIEQVRFGERLRTRFEIEEGARTLAVPPLVLQPLVENAVHHGVAHLINGGEVRVAARRDGDRLLLEVENPCDAERPASRGAGVGLANVRARLDALFEHRAGLELAVGDERYLARVLLPARPATG